jgi:hypothetical protein
MFVRWAHIVLLALLLLPNALLELTTTNSELQTTVTASLVQRTKFVMSWAWLILKLLAQQGSIALLQGSSCHAR